MSGSGARKFWGWGYENGPGAEYEGALRHMAEEFGVDEPPALRPAPDLAAVQLPEPRIHLRGVPGPLRHMLSAKKADRARYSHGQAFVDVVDAFEGHFPHVPDLVAFPASEDDVVALLRFATKARVAVVPFGGGTSVVRGVTPEVGAGFEGVITVVMEKMGRVLSVDHDSHVARVQAGTLGPSLEEQLKPHGMTLRFFPQSFEFSSVGGWVATRAGGHFATGPTHIDDLVLGVRVATPAGVLQTRLVPASSAGPAEHRVYVGSEGAFGIITEAWLLVRPRPRFRASATVLFDGFAGAGAGAVRRVVQAGLQPANLRLVDRNEARSNGLGDGERDVLLVAFESPALPQGALLEQALALCEEAGGEVDRDSVAVRDGSGGGGARDGGAGSWRDSFIGLPYMRDLAVAAGLVAETFETACTWADWPRLHAGITTAVEAVIRERCAGKGRITCRFTHARPAGPAPYFTVVAQGVGGRAERRAQWAAIKAAASEAILELGGTISHHHASGREHRPWYEREASAMNARVLGAIKSEVDPAWVMNPGVLVRSRL